MAHLSKYGCVDPNDPEARGRCDRGGETRKLSELRPEYEYRGLQLVPNGFLVCDKHRDKPHPPWVRPHDPDPEPVLNPRTNLELRLSHNILQGPDGKFVKAPDGSWVIIEKFHRAEQPTDLTILLPDGTELALPDGVTITNFGGEPPVVFKTKDGTPLTASDGSWIME